MSDEVVPPPLAEVASNTAVSSSDTMLPQRPPLRIDAPACEEVPHNDATASPLHANEEEPLYYFHDPQRLPPAVGRYLRVISCLIAPFFDDAYTDYYDLPSIFGGSAVDGVADLCTDARSLLEKEPTVIGVEVRPTEDLVLVGDIHGQFTDLLFNVFAVHLRERRDAMGKTQETTTTDTVLREHSCEGMRKFLFLGDYVDRGPRSVEVMLLLLALKVEYPNHIFLLRGNHEDAQTSRMYGFLKECIAKLPSVSSCFTSESSFTGNETGIGTPFGLPEFSNNASWMHFNSLFCWLPLAAVVRCAAGHFFCTHGGLSPFTKRIEGLQFLRRQEYGSAGYSQFSDVCDLALTATSAGERGGCSHIGLNGGSSTSSDDSQQETTANQCTIINGLLWSDPSDIGEGCTFNVRGCGYNFGARVTRTFLDANHGYPFTPTHHTASPSPALATPTDNHANEEAHEKEAFVCSPEMHFIVRAHQCVREGYQWSHDGCVLTLFSASNYCGIQQNAGAIAILRGATTSMDQPIHFDVVTYDVYQRPASARLAGSPKASPLANAAASSAFALHCGSPRVLPPPPARHLIKNPVLESYFNRDE